MSWCGIRSRSIREVATEELEARGILRGFERRFGARDRALATGLQDVHDRVIITLVLRPALAHRFQQFVDGLRHLDLDVPVTDVVTG